MTYDSKKWLFNRKRHNKSQNGGEVVFKVGDRVAYRAAFLRSIGDYSYDSASMRGTVVEVDPKPFRPGVQYMKVQWDGAELAYESSYGVLSTHILLADRIHLEPA